MNLGYRFFSEDDALNYYNMSVAIMTKDIEQAGLHFGEFIQVFLMTEVPEQTAVPSYTAVGGLM